MSKKSEKEDVQSGSSLAAMMRGTLNTHMKKEVAKSHSKEDMLLQISNWIPMGEWYQKTTGGHMPLGHYTIFLGLSNSGKTSALMEAAINCQKSGGLCYLIDSERKFSFERFDKMGGKTEDLVTVSTTSLEDAWDAVLGVLKTIHEYRLKHDPDKKTPILIVWDSLGAAISGKLIDQDADKNNVGVESKINNLAIRKVKVWLELTDAALVTICHHYWTVPLKYGEISKLVIKGGQEIEWLATHILMFEKGAKITREVKGEKQRIGVTCRVEAHKCHSAARTIKSEIHVVDIGILNNSEELSEYRKTIAGQV